MHPPPLTVAEQLDEIERIARKIDAGRRAAAKAGILTPALETGIERMEARLVVMLERLRTHVIGMRN